MAETGRSRRQKQVVQPARANADKRFADAFAACLEGSPDKAPSAMDLRRKMGRVPGHTLNGREAWLRRELLEAAGFVKNEMDGRWQKP